MSAGDGLALIEQIRGEQVLRELPVLALARSEEVREELVASVDCVGKPYDRTYVVARIRELVGAPPVRDSILVIASDEQAELVTTLSRGGFVTTVSTTGVEGLQNAATARPTAVIIGATSDMDAPSVIRRLRQTPALRTTRVSRRKSGVEPRTRGRRRVRETASRARAGADPRCCGRRRAVFGGLAPRVPRVDEIRVPRGARQSPAQRGLQCCSRSTGQANS